MLDRASDGTTAILRLHLAGFRNERQFRRCDAEFPANYSDAAALKSPLTAGFEALATERSRVLRRSVTSGRRGASRRSPPTFP
jgi:hypothetical protein